MKPVVVLLWILACLCLSQGRKRKVYGCPNGWTRFRGTDRCYYINKIKTTFDMAKKKCESMNSQLTPILSCYDQVDLSDLLANERWKCKGRRACMEFWVKIFKPDGLNAWRTTRTTNIDQRFQFWARGFPQGNGRCAFMSFDENIERGSWKNGDCDRQLKSVCIACTNDFHYLPDTNECVYLNPVKMNWNDARKACTKLKRGAQLLTIKSRRKMDAVTSFLEKQYRPTGKPEFQGCVMESRTLRNNVTMLNNTAWIGGQTKNPKKCGTPYLWKPIELEATPFLYTNWLPGNPSCSATSREFCVRIADSDVQRNKWDDYQCEQAMCSICEFV